MQKQDTQSQKTEIAARRQQVGEKYLKGMPQALIASELGYDQATISRDLSELRKEWLDRSINHIDQKKGIELAKLDQLESTYWAAWEESKEDAVIHTTGTTAKGFVNTTRTEGRRPGNPAFLEGVLKCIEKRCQIIGINAPVKVAPTNPNGDKSYDPSGLDRSLSALADALRTTVPGPAASETNSVAAPKQAPMVSITESSG
jgi:hypothetical protein